MKNKNNIRSITAAAIVAAIYVVLTYITNLFGLASGVIQCRLSEGLCVLPAFTPAAVPGLFIGCVLSNLLTGSIPLDVIFGSLATLIGAVGTYYLARMKINKFTYTLPPIIANTVIIPFVLKYAYGFSGSVWYFAVTVGAGEVISCGVIGMLLYGVLKKNNWFLFK